MSCSFSQLSECQDSLQVRWLSRLSSVTPLHSTFKGTHLMYHVLELLESLIPVLCGKDPLGVCCGSNSKESGSWDGRSSWMG